MNDMSNVVRNLSSSPATSTNVANVAASSPVTPGQGIQSFQQLIRKQMEENDFFQDFNFNIHHNMHDYQEDVHSASSSGTSTTSLGSPSLGNSNVGVAFMGTTGIETAAVDTTASTYSLIWNQGVQDPQQLLPDDIFDDLDPIPNLGLNMHSQEHVQPFTGDKAHVQDKLLPNDISDDLNPVPNLGLNKHPQEHVQPVIRDQAYDADDFVNPMSSPRSATATAQTHSSISQDQDLQMEAAERTVVINETIAMAYRSGIRAGIECQRAVMSATVSRTGTVYGLPIPAEENLVIQGRIQELGDHVIDHCCGGARHATLARDIRRVLLDAFPHFLSPTLTPATSTMVPMFTTESSVRAQGMASA